MAQLKIQLVVDDQGKVKLQGVKGEVQDIDKSLGTLTSTANTLKNALIGAFGAFSVYQIVNFGKECLRAADAIGKTADAIDISTRALQEYQYVARLSGVETELLNKSFEQFTKRLGELRAGTGDLEYKLKDMNMQLLEQLKGAGDTTEALDLLFKAMDKTSNAADKAALAAAAFGRGGVKMVNMLREGYEAMERMREKANALGIVLDEDLIRRAEEINDQFATMQQIMKTQLTAAFVDAAPAILKVAEALASMATSIGDLVRHIEKLDGMQTTIRLLYGLAGASVGGLIGGPFGAGIGGGLGLALGGILAPGNISGEEEDFLKKAWEDVLGGKKGGKPPAAPPEKVYIDIKNEWNQITQDMSKAFSNALVRGFDDFAEQARQIFARDFVDRILQGPINLLSDSIFGASGFLTKTTLPGGAMLGDVLGAGALGYGLGGMYGGLGAGGGYMIGSATGLGGPLGMMAGGLAGTFIEKLTQELPESPFEIILRASVTDAIGGGFDDAIKSQEFQTFKDSFGQSLNEMIGQSFKNAFIAMALDKVMDILQPSFNLLAIYAKQQNPGSGIAGGVATGLPPISLADITADFKAAFGGMSEIYAEMEPIFNSFMEAMNELTQALGINTDVTQSNTDALIGPVEAFLRDLSVGPLAPVQSMEGLQNAYAGLLAQTQNDSGMFSSLAGFARSDLLPFARAYGGDYGSIVEQIKQDVTSLPWYQQAKTEVNVKVYLDGQELRSTINTLIKSDPDIQDSIKRVRY